MEKEAVVCGQIISYFLLAWSEVLLVGHRWKHPTDGNLELDVGAEATVSGDKDLAVSPGCRLAPEGRAWSKRRQSLAKVQV